MWGLKAISEWERILLAWFLDALLFIRILWKCVKWQNQFQKEHGSASKSLKPGMWKSSVHSCTMASKNNLWQFRLPWFFLCLKLKDWNASWLSMTKLRLSYTNLGPTPLFWAFPHADLQASAMQSPGDEAQRSEEKALHTSWITNSTKIPFPECHIPP